MSDTHNEAEEGWWGTPLLRQIDSLHERENQVFLLLTLAIGALTGLAVVAFIALTERLGMRLYPVGSAAWRRVLIPIGGSLGIGYLLFRYFPDARGSGVPQTKAALFAREGVITLGTVLGKFFCTSVTLASGIPLGREGPAVQVGGGIASVLGRHLGLRPEKVKALIPAGAAAAIAAAFNTPLAAVLFALEEVMGDLHAPVLASVVLASATSWVVLRLILGNNPLFHVPQYRLIHPLELGVYAVLGVAGGLVSVAFTRLLLGMRKRFLQFPQKSLWLQPVVGGLLVGLMGWVVPQVLGVGYGYVGDALNGRMALKLMALLVIPKLFGATTSYASGNAGGIFGPSLFIGATLGGTVGSMAHHLLPTYTAAPGAYALVGMGAAFAGIVPIYTALTFQDGIHLPTAETRRRRDQHRVIQAMHSTVEVLPAQATVGEALERSESSTFRAWPVTDQRGVIGVVSLVTLERELAEGAAAKRLGELVDARLFPHVHMDQTLDLALELMGAAQLELLPVVSRADIHKLEGVITLRDVLNSFGVTTQLDTPDRSILLSTTSGQS